MKENHPHFPPTLTALPQWVCYRLEPDKRSGRTAKVPYNPHTGHRASASNPATWGTLAQALICSEKYMFSGVGFVFTEQSGIVGIDIDHCLDEQGQPNEIATDILVRLPNTHIEISPSGTGLHIFLLGVLPPGGNRNIKHGVEMYASARYFTMTGRRYENAPLEIAEDNGALEYIHAKYVAQSKKTKQKSSYQAGAALPDDEIIKLAQQSKDSAEFTALWRGEFAEGRHSEADYALCRKLAFWTGRNEAQMDRLFRQSGLYREKWDERRNAAGETYGQITISKASERTASVYSPPAPKKPPDVFEQGGCYYRRKSDKFYQITNFVVEPKQMIEGDDDAQLSCNLVTEGGERFPQNIISGDFNTLPKFKAMLNKRTIALSFMGGEGDLELLKIHIYSLPWQKKKGVKALGIYPRGKKLVFVTPQGAVFAGGRKASDIVQMERYKSIDSSILQAELLQTDGLRQLAQHLLAYNEPAKTVPILAWTAACFIKPHLRRTGIKFPHLFLIGEAGSGKSNTLERAILPLFSRSKVTAAGQVTSFTLMRESNSSNIFPQAFDEFKPSKIDKNRLNCLYNHFRDSYDFHEGQRGRADQTAVVYDLFAPIVVAGEESADESAMRERSIELLFSKTDIKKAEHKSSFVWISGNAKLLNSLGRLLLDVALDTTIDEAAEWFEEGRAYFDSGLTVRVHDNLCCLYAGLSLVAKLCGRLGVSWNTLFPFDREACAQYIEYGAKEYLLDGGLSNRSIVEQSFEVMSRMKLKPNDDYAFENHGQFLCLHLPGIYDRYTRYRRDCAIVGEVLPYAQFKKQLEHSEFFVQKNAQKRMGDSKKVWIVDFAKLSQKCDVSGFLRGEDSPEPAPEPAQEAIALS